jgi:hypothetical protein
MVIDPQNNSPVSYLAHKRISTGDWCLERCGHFRGHQLITATCPLDGFVKMVDQFWLPGKRGVVPYQHIHRSAWHQQGQQVEEQGSRFQTMRLHHPCW